MPHYPKKITSINNLRNVQVDFIEHPELAEALFKENLKYNEECRKKESFEYNTSNSKVDKWRFIAIPKMKRPNFWQLNKKRLYKKECESIIQRYKEWINNFVREKKIKQNRKNKNMKTNAQMKMLAKSGITLEQTDRNQFISAVQTLRNKGFWVDVIHLFKNGKDKQKLPDNVFVKVGNQNKELTGFCKVTIKSPSGVNFHGQSLCTEQSYDKKKGLAIALGRALKSMRSKKNSVPNVSVFTIPENKDIMDYFS